MVLLVTVFKIGFPDSLTGLSLQNRASPKLGPVCGGLYNKEVHELMALASIHDAKSILRFHSKNSFLNLLSP